MINHHNSSYTIFKGLGFWGGRAKETHEEAVIANIYKVLIITNLFFILVGCAAQPTTAIQQECPEVMSTPAPFPEFIFSVFPLNSISKAEYDKSVKIGAPDLPYMGGVSITVSAIGVDQSVFESVDSNRGKMLVKRFLLLVDNHIVPENNAMITDLLMPEGLFIFEWIIDLNPGFHTANIAVDLDSGKPVTYSWSFCIVP